MWHCSHVSLYRVKMKGHWHAYQFQEGKKLFCVMTHIHENIYADLVCEIPCYLSLSLSLSLFLFYVRIFSLSVSRFLSLSSYHSVFLSLSLSFSSSVSLLVSLSLYFSFFSSSNLSLSFLVFLSISLPFSLPQFYSSCHRSLSLPLFSFFPFISLYPSLTHTLPLFHFNVSLSFPSIVLSLLFSLVLSI